MSKDYSQSLFLVFLYVSVNVCTVNIVLHFPCGLLSFSGGDASA